MGLTRHKAGGKAGKAGQRYTYGMKMADEEQLKWSDITELYTVRVITETFSYPCLVHVCEGIYCPTSPVGTFSGGDYLKLHGYESIDKVVAYPTKLQPGGILSEYFRNWSVPVLIPQDYRAKAKVIPKNGSGRLYPTVELLLKDFPKYVRTGREINAFDRNGRSITIAKLSKLELLRRKYAHTPSNVICNFQEQEVELSHDCHGEFSIVPNERKYTVREIVSMFELPQLIQLEYLEGGANKYMTNHAQQALSNLEAFKGRMYVLDEAITEQLVYGTHRLDIRLNHKSSQQEREALEKYKGRQAIVVIPIDSTASFQLALNRDSATYETVFSHNYARTIKTAELGRLYIDSKGDTDNKELFMPVEDEFFSNDHAKKTAAKPTPLPRATKQAAQRKTKALTPGPQSAPVEGTTFRFPDNQKRRNNTEKSVDDDDSDDDGDDYIYPDNPEPPVQMNTGVAPPRPKRPDGFPTKCQSLPQTVLPGILTLPIRKKDIKNVIKSTIAKFKDIGPWKGKDNTREDKIAKQLTSNVAYKPKISERNDDKSSTDEEDDRVYDYPDMSTVDVTQLESTPGAFGTVKRELSIKRNRDNRESWVLPDQIIEKNLTPLRSATSPASSTPSQETVISLNNCSEQLPWKPSMSVAPQPAKPIATLAPKIAPKIAPKPVVSRKPEDNVLPVSTSSVDVIKVGPEAWVAELSGMTVKTVCSYIKKLGLGDKVEMFSEKMIDGETLLNMSDDMLKDEFSLTELELMRIQNFKNFKKLPKT